MAALVLSRGTPPPAEHKEADSSPAPPLLAGLLSLRSANPRSPLFQEEWLGDDVSQWPRLTARPEDGALLEL